MVVRRGAACLALAMGLALVAGCKWFSSGVKGPPIAPPQDVEMDPQALQKFRHEIVEYLEMRQAVVQRIPRVNEKSKPEEIAAYRAKLADGIRAGRRREKQGMLFTPKVDAAFRSTLRRELGGPDGEAMLREIRAGNPRVEGTPRRQDPTREVKPPVAVAVNAVYPAEAPVSSVPPSLLLRLPVLPEQLKYGFVGRTLILRDAEAEVILDFIADAVPDTRLPR